MRKISKPKKFKKMKMHPDGNEWLVCILFSKNNSKMIDKLNFKMC